MLRPLLPYPFPKPFKAVPFPEQEAVGLSRHLTCQAPLKLGFYDFGFRAFRAFGDLELGIRGLGLGLKALYFWVGAFDSGVLSGASGFRV